LLSSIASEKEGGTNVDLWTFEELEELVRQFKSNAPVGEPQENTDEYQGRTETQTSEEYKNEGRSEGDDQSNSASKQQGQSALNEPLKEKEDYIVETVNVKLAETNILNDYAQIEVTVVEPELVKGGLFSASYIQYKIKTEPLGWCVKRRYSDFFWLRSTLLKFHPGVVIPPIPRKKNKGKFENDFIKKRMYFLERFLNACVKNDDLKASRFLMYFLSVEDANAFKNKQKEADKFTKISKIEEMSNLAGQVRLEITPELKSFGAHAGELFNQTDPIYKKIRKLSKQLTLDLDQVSNTIFSMGECFAALYAASTNYNKNVSVGKSPQLEDIYLTLNNMMVTWGEQMLGQIKIVQKNLCFFFKYAYFENENFKEALKERSNIGLEYVRRKKELFAKKEKLFALGDITKWELSSAKLREYSREELMKNKALAMELMLPKETAQVAELRTQFAFYNAQCFSEITKGLQEKCKQYAGNFHEFAKLQADNLTEVHVHWADMMAHFTESKPNKEIRQVLARDNSRLDEYKIEGAEDG